MLPWAAAVGVAGQVKMPAYLVGKQFAAAIGAVNQSGQPMRLHVGGGVTAGFQQLLRLQKVSLGHKPRVGTLDHDPIVTVQKPRLVDFVTYHLAGVLGHRAVVGRQGQNALDRGRCPLAGKPPPGHAFGAGRAGDLLLHQQAGNVGAGLTCQK